MTDKNLSWGIALQDQHFRKHIIFTLLLLIICALVAPHLFKYIENREGIVLIDPVLDLLTPADLSNLIFILLYIFIAAGTFLLLIYPEKLLLGLKAYLLITVMRFITLLLVPLNPPPGILELHDPFVDNLFYRQSITKDLFFSGHTGIMALFFFLHTDLRRMRKVFAGSALLIGLLLLIQHAHYTIDVLAAPGFAWAAHRLALVIRWPR